MTSMTTSTTLAPRVSSLSTSQVLLSAFQGHQAEGGAFGCAVTCTHRPLSTSITQQVFLPSPSLANFSQISCVSRTPAVIQSIHRPSRSSGGWGVPGCRLWWPLVSSCQPAVFKSWCNSFSSLVLSANWLTVVIPGALGSCILEICGWSPCEFNFQRCN